MGDFDFKVIDPVEEIQHIVNEIKRYFVENGNKDTKAVIGISGGKDSTIAAALLVRALGKDRVVGVLMPNRTQNDIDDSLRICEILGISHYSFNIGYAYDAMMNAFNYDLALPATEQVTTNVPPRLRMTALYMVAAAIGGRVINTGNASELYIGYTTKYGDLAGDFAILKDYYVREVIEIGENLDEIPSDLIHKAPGDGLTGKTDEDQTGISYDVLDAYLLDEVVPDYETLRNIQERHKRNMHKRIIQIPYVHAYTRHWHENSDKKSIWD